LKDIVLTPLSVAVWVFDIGDALKLQPALYFCRTDRQNNGLTSRRDFVNSRFSQPLCRQRASNVHLQEFFLQQNPSYKPTSSLPFGHHQL
jgi:hypothetical protein